MNPTFRTQKRQARVILHAVMSELVWYLPFKLAQPVSVTTRLHLTFDDLGEIRRAGFAETTEIVPRAVFLSDDIAPSKMAIIVTDTQGAFQIDRVHPKDDITIKVDLTRLPIGQYAQWGLNPSAIWGGLADPALTLGSNLMASTTTRISTLATLT